MTMTQIQAFAGTFVFALVPTYLLAPTAKGAHRHDSTLCDTSINWKDKSLAAQLAKNVKAGPKIALQSSGQGAAAATLALLKQQRQSAAAAANSNKSAIGGTGAAPQP